MMHRFSFSFRNMTAIALVALGIQGMGCAMDGGVDSDPEGVELGAAMQGSGGDPGNFNHLRPTCLFDDGVQRTVRALGAGPLSSDHSGAMPSMPHMPGANEDADATSCRHDFLDILVGCALPDGASVEDLEDQAPTRGGLVPKTYSGQIGLAPDWTTRALTTKEKELVTACVLARTNRFGKMVRIMLEGDTPALSDDPYQYDYSYVESTVWGNMFDSKTPLEPTRSPEKLTAARAFEAHVCRNHGAAWSKDAAFRVCDEGGCGFVEHDDCDAPSSACSGPEGSRPSYCTAWQSRLTAYLRSSTPELYDEPRTSPQLPFLPKPLRTD